MHFTINTRPYRINFFFQVVVFRQHGVGQQSTYGVLRYRRPSVIVPRRWLTKNPLNRGHTLVPEYQKDKVPPGFEFVYAKSNQSYYTIGIPSFVVLWAGTLAVVVYFVARHLMNKTEAKKRTWSRAYHSDSLFPFLYVAGLFLPGLFYYFMKMSKNVMLRMYMKESSGEYYGILLRYGCFRKSFKFNQLDVKILPKVTMEGNVSVLGHKMLVMESDFSDVRHFNRFLGYAWDRESDFQRQLEEESMQNLMSNIGKRYEKARDRQFEERYLQKRKTLNVERKKTVKT